MKPAALLFLPYLAPYRIDVLNELGTYFDLTVVFQFNNAPEQNFNQDQLRKKLTVNFEIFDKGFNIGTRQIRIGVSNLIKKYKPEIIFTNEYGPTSLLISLYQRLGIYEFIHYATTSDNVIMAENTKWFRRCARSLVLSSVKGIIVYGKDVKEWYTDKFTQLTVRICPNIQDPEILTTRLKKIETKAGQYEVNYNLKNKKIILYVGRLHPVKGLDLLINAFSQISTGEERLVLVGSGPQELELKEKIRNHKLENSVIFAGRHEGDALYAWYSMSNFLVLPSIHEPFGAVINESLVFGLPVLCSVQAGAKFYVQENVNGNIFDPEIESDFCFHLKRSLKKYENRKENLMNYSFRESVKEYYLAYKEIKQTV